MKIALVNIQLFLLIILIYLFGSCSNNPDYLTSGERSVVMDSVQQMFGSIAASISSEGPIAWLRYFENSPDFYMASQGQLAFSNKDSAAHFLKNTYSKSVRKIELKWNNLRIDPLTSKLAGVAAIFHEDITDTAGRKLPYDGYFTGIAHQSQEGWQLRSVHWSMITTH